MPVTVPRPIACPGCHAAVQMTREQVLRWVSQGVSLVACAGCGAEFTPTEWALYNGVYPRPGDAYAGLMTLLEACGIERVKPAVLTEAALRRGGAPEWVIEKFFPKTTEGGA